MSNSVVTEGKRVYFYENGSELSYYDIPNPSSRITFPLMAQKVSSPNSTVSVSSKATVILQPNTMAYGYANSLDLNPTFRAAGSFVAGSVYPVNAVDSFVPSIAKISHIEFRYYDPTKWEQFCTGIFSTKDKRCYYQTAGGRKYISNQSSGNLAGSSPGIEDPIVSYRISVQDQNEQSVGNMSIFIIILIGVIFIVIVSIVALYGFNFFASRRKVNSSLNGDKSILH